MFRKLFFMSLGLLLVLVILSGCVSKTRDKTVPHENRWGIYSLDIFTQEVELIYSSGEMISGLKMNPPKGRFVFSQRIGGDDDGQEEICVIGADGSGFMQLTNNSVIDTYPTWSPDGSRIAFLSWRDHDLDVYVMESDGGGVAKLYNSGFHDADIDWVGNKIVFTRNSQIWIMDDNGDSARQVSNFSIAGVWGKANLPFGDYDPRLSPDGNKIVFSRLSADTSEHGNYDFYLINPDGSGETSLTSDSQTQGLPGWSPLGDKIVYVVAAINDTGMYDIYLMNSDGTNNQDITPSYFPPTFLCHSTIFSKDGSKLFFVGEWWA